ncbi:peptidoglycan recognition protein family protein [Brevibacillus laterosporus]|uniref:N-acetylmuramoyl-L-alanine amidase n=1 Tax=Brevibacillus laterosporus TaxID=1465 RepID=A0AAP8QH82_BRELA|nr:N-acetylmuramoyl-L-alanine amidase [Brevibacillus laterosporus]PPB10925.1 N-acetylmuramoyl-L-alanine amidase [Brevibacillus laterosporus]
MQIIQDIVPAGQKNRPGRKMIPKYITIHNTGNAGKGADALSHAKYIKGDAAAQRQASWHFTVDDKRIIQHLPLYEMAWHCGDGNGPGNSSSIGIEICENIDGDIRKAEELAAQLAADLLKQFNLGIDRVKQHWDWSGKNCPHVLRARPNGWRDFVALIKSKGEVNMKPEVANEIISHLQGQWAFYNQMGMADKASRIGHLADELRVASGQETQNK